MYAHPTSPVGIGWVCPNHVTDYNASYSYHCSMAQHLIYDVLKAMKKRSEDNIPFSFSFVTCDTSKRNSNGVKHVARAKLRTGLSAEHGIKSRSLIGYTDLDTNQDRWFYLPLLISFNNKKL